MSRSSVENPPHVYRLQPQSRVDFVAEGLSRIINRAMGNISGERGPSVNADVYTTGSWQEDPDIERRALIIDAINDPVFHERVKRRQREREGFEGYITGRS